MKVIRYKTFSDKGKDRPALSTVNSHRGLGRSFLLGDMTGAAGGLAGKMKADDLDAMGMTDEAIIRRSSKHAAKVGSALGAAKGAAVGALASGPVGIIPGAVAGGIFSGAGAYLGAKKNAQTRIKKRKELMN